MLLLLFVLTGMIHASIGTVLAMRGEAKVHRLYKVPQTLKAGQQIKKGDEIITQRLSRVQVMLKDRTVITIGANSTFKFDDFFFDGTKKSKLAMRAKRGFFRSVSGKIGKIAPKRFKVRTTSATIGIRGTDFSGYILGNQEFYLCNAGAISVTVGEQVQNLVPGDIYQMDKQEGKAKLKKIIQKLFKKSVAKYEKSSGNSAGSDKDEKSEKKDSSEKKTGGDTSSGSGSEAGTGEEKPSGTDPEPGSAFDPDVDSDTGTSGATVFEEFSLEEIETIINTEGILNELTPAGEPCDVDPRQ